MEKTIVKTNQKDRSEWLDKLVILQNRIEILETLASDKATRDKVNRTDLFMVSQLYKLITKMIDCDQDDTDTNINGRQGSFKTTKIMRIHRFIENYVLDYHNQDKIVSGGLFLEVPVYILDSGLVNLATRNRYGAVLYPEEFGLPGHDKCNYSTLKSVDGKSYIALAKGSWLDDWITLSRHWEYVTMSDN